MHAPINPTGRQIGWAFEAAGLSFTSRERLPALALADIRSQIYQANGQRRTADALPSPTHTAQLRPHHEGAQPATRVGCSSNASAIGEVRSKVTSALSRLAAGYSPRVPA